MTCTVKRERLPWALAVGAVALTVACSRPAAPDVPAAPPPTAPPTEAVTPTPSPEPSEAPTDPYAVPDVIDEAYVERVLEALGRSYAAAIAEVARAGELTGRAKSLIEATHGPEAAKDTIKAVRRINRQRPDLFNPDARTIAYDVLKLESATSECIFALVEVDSSDLQRRGGRARIEEYFWLEGAPIRDLQSNPTPWVIVAEKRPPGSGEEFADPCA